MNEAMSASTDPVCGRAVDPANALYAELNGQSLYFCSESCRQRFCPGPPVPGHDNARPGLSAAAADGDVQRRG